MERKQSEVVIVGGVACGPKTAATLARRMPEARITLYQKEKHLSYGTCGLPYYASGDIDSFDALTRTSYDIVRDAAFFHNTKGFEAVTGAEVIAIDREKKVVTVKKLDTGETFEHEYAALVLATGATPTPPPFPVAESPKIRPFTRPDDAISFRRLAEQGQVGKVVIVGGGSIGCELAEAATILWGLDCTLIEKENHLLPYALDSDMAEIVKREMARHDVTVMTGTTVDSVDLDDEGNPVVQVRGGDPIAADFMFLCLGVRPENSLAKDADLEIGETGGIIVDEHLRTSDPAIYAGGDCVESIHRITWRKFYLPMGSLANRHGRVIAENICGIPVTFGGVLGAFLIKIFDLNVGSVGLSQAAAEQAGIEARAVWGSFPDKPDYYPESKTMSLKMVYSPATDGVLGLQAAGTGDICRRIDVASAFLRINATLDHILDFEHGYAPPYAEAIDPLHHLAAIAIAQQRRDYAFIGPNGDYSSFGEDTIWLDVREPSEIEAYPWTCGDGRRPGKSLAIPLDDLRNHLDELDKDARYVIVCKRGPRSYQAATILREAEIDKVEILGGGYQAAEA